MKPHILDNAAWASLSGPHASIAEVSGLARRYPVEVSPLSGIADNQNPQAWRDLAALIGPNGITTLTGNALHIPDNWVTLDAGLVVQLLGEDVDGC